MLSSCTYKHPGWCRCDCMDTRTPRYNKDNTYLSLFLHIQVRVEMTQHKDKCLMLSSCTYKYPGWCGCDCTDTRTPMYNKENTYLSIFPHIQVRVEMTQHKDENTQVQHREHLPVHPPSHPLPG